LDFSTDLFFFYSVFLTVDGFFLKLISGLVLNFPSIYSSSNTDLLFWTLPIGFDYVAPNNNFWVILIVNLSTTSSNSCFASINSFLLMTDSSSSSFSDLFFLASADFFLNLFFLFASLSFRFSFCFDSWLLMFLSCYSSFLSIFRRSFETFFIPASTSCINFICISIFSFFSFFFPVVKVESTVTYDFFWGGYGLGRLSSTSSMFTPVIRKVSRISDLFPPSSSLMISSLDRVYWILPKKYSLRGNNLFSQH